MPAMMFYGEGSDLPEPTLDEAIRWASDMQLLEDDAPDPYTDDPITLYRSRGEVLE